MEEENRRIDIDDLPKATEELTDEETKEVQGGHKVGAGHLILPNSNVYTPGNTIGGSLGETTGNTIGGSLGGDVYNRAKP